MRLISERISVDETKSFSIVILGKIERWKESILLFWVLSWTFCGIVFLTYFFGDTPYRFDIAMLVLILFWLYFEIRILKVFLYRRKGYEKMEFDLDLFTLRTKVITEGKKHAYSVNEISEFKMVPHSDKNFFSFMDNSFWVLGGDRIYFDYFGKKVVFAKQVDPIEVKKLLSLLNGQLKKSKRISRKQKGQNEASV